MIDFPSLSYTSTRDFHTLDVPELEKGITFELSLYNP